MLSHCSPNQVRIGVLDLEYCSAQRTSTRHWRCENPIYTMAPDAENARKRSDKDRREAENYGGSKLARDMLPVYDNMKRALEAANEAGTESNAALVEGVELTMRELLNVFSKHGMTVISPEVGDKFDPQQHQAMFEAPVPGTKAGDIIDVAAQGFMLHDRLLRPAQVGVSSTPAS